MGVRGLYGSLESVLNRPDKKAIGRIRMNEALTLTVEQRTCRHLYRSQYPTGMGEEIRSAG